MALRVKCPSCGRDLIARDAALGSRATCPACLAEVSVPETAREEPPPPREGALSCPRCGRSVERIWINCPWCDEPLRGRDFSDYGSVDRDVRRDRKWTSGLVIFLALLGGLAVIYLGFFAVVGVAQGGYQLALYLVVGLLFLAGLTTLIVFVRSGGNPRAGDAGRIAVGTLAMAGGLIAVTSCVGLAIFAFLFAVCLAGGGGHF